METPKVLKKFDLFIDGRGHAAVMEEVTLPTITEKTEDWQGGGMDGEIDIGMGLEKLELEYSVGEYNKEILKAFSGRNAIGFTARGALENEEGTVEAVIVEMRGKHRQFDPGNWKAGDHVKPKMKATLTYYKLSIGGEVIYEIDVINSIRIVGGVDQMQEIRQALGQ
ncbi:phage major tail tube protein [Kiloniella litopenaei]|uniref:phage major tail tube protein n=1 Tax=Kiloniella litopenaei TaxID=1549748 RepID=UPI003BAB67DF